MPDRVRSKAPPRWVIDKVANPLMRRLLPGRVGRWLPGVALLRFRGRRSGRSFEVPAGIYDYEGAQVVFSDSAWVANFRGGGEVEVVRRGRSVTAFAEVVSDPAYVGPAIRAVLAAGASKTMLGVAIDRGHHPTDEELSAVREAVVIRHRP